MLGKRNVAVQGLHELFEKFNCVYDVKSGNAARKRQAEAKYKSVKKQLELIADRFIEENIDKDDERILENIQTQEKIKKNYFKILNKYANRKKEANTPKTLAKDKLQHSKL